MAHSVPTHYCIREDGNDSNSGAFAPFNTGAGTDRSKSATPHLIIDGVSVSATVHTTTTQVTITGAYTVDLLDRVNYLNITGGTATTGNYCITAVDVPNNRYTLDRAAGTAGQTVQGRIGGAKQTFGWISNNTNVISTSAIIWLKEGTAAYAVATSINLFSGTDRKMIGFQTTAGDGLARVQINATANMTNVCQGAATLGNLYFTHSGGVTISSAMAQVTELMFNCRSTGGVNGLQGANSAARIRDCFSDSATTAAFTSTISSGVGYERCRALNSPVGFDLFAARVQECLIENASTAGIRQNSTGGIWIKNVTIINATSGITGANNHIIDTLLVDCDTSLVGATTAAAAVGYVENTWSYNASVADQSGFYLVGAVQTLSANPFTNQGAGDYSLNNTVGGGAECRGDTRSFIGLSTSEGFKFVGCFAPDTSGEIGIPIIGQAWPGRVL